MALITCDECGNQISDKAAACPNCGAPVSEQIAAPEASPANIPTKEKTSNQTAMILVAIIGLIAVIIFVMEQWKEKEAEAFNESISKSPPSTKFKPQLLKKPQIPKKASLEVVDIEWKTGKLGNRYIVGTVNNNSNYQFGYVQVQINLYDNSDLQVGSTLANVNNLEPNSSWKFEAIVMEDSATKARVKGVDGY